VPVTWRRIEAAAEHATVYLAFELSKAKWKLGVLLPGSQELCRYTIGGGDLAALAARLAEMRKKAAAAAGGRPVRILSCYEAGLDGHWLNRWLTGQGIINHEIDPSSIEVNRRARRAKTDRIDLEKLMRTFLADLRASRGSAAWSTCRRLKMRPASAVLVSASVSSMSARLTSIASRDCYTDRASAMSSRSLARSSNALPTREPATDDRDRRGLQRPSNEAKA
jgi:hypothetical protein